MSDFSKKAEHWDNDPERRDRAGTVAEAILEEIDINDGIRALEYGSGTGLLSFELYNKIKRSKFKKIILADNSRGMLEMADKKIEEREIDKVESLFIDLTKEPVPEENFDLIYTLMSLHHIIDLDQILDIFYSILNSGGYLCIADLVKEKGTYHAKNFKGHNGFERKYLEEKIKNRGWKIISYQIVYVRKKVIDGIKKFFPIFLLIAQK